MTLFCNDFGAYLPGNLMVWEPWLLYAYYLASHGASHGYSLEHLEGGTASMV